MEMRTTQARIAEPRSHARRRPIRQKGRWFYLWHAAGFVTKQYDAHIEHLPEALDGLQIAHLSDLHIRDHWSKGYDHLIEHMDQLAPDLILVTGDIVENRLNHFPAMPHVGRLLHNLKARLGLYTILGNHDNLRVGFDLENMGIPCLIGQRKLLHHHGSTIELIGAPGPERKILKPSFASSFDPPVQGVPRILMCHFPDHFPRLQSLEPDLYLCGHTHGGQVCLPGGFPLICHDSSPRHLCRGIHRRGKTHYIVNHGFGFSGGLTFRLFCPPELVLITLRSANRPQE
jgi:predicted MPP superfamily phosphohydrolase